LGVCATGSLVVHELVQAAGIIASHHATTPTTPGRGFGCSPIGASVGPGVHGPPACADTRFSGFATVGPTPHVRSLGSRSGHPRSTPGIARSAHRLALGAHRRSEGDMR